VFLFTLPVSTVITEQSFSAMYIIKTRICNKIENEFLMYFLILYFIIFKENRECNKYSIVIWF
jgi:hypothetical protein